MNVGNTVINHDTKLMTQLMVVTDLHVLSAAEAPREAYAPLVVDADAPPVIVATAVTEAFESVKAFSIRVRTWRVQLGFDDIVCRDRWGMEMGLESIPSRKLEILVIIIYRSRTELWTVWCIATGRHRRS